VRPARRGPRRCPGTPAGRRPELSLTTAVQHCDASPHRTAHSFEGWNEGDGCKCSVRLRPVWIHEEHSLSLTCCRPCNVAARGVAGLLRDDEIGAQQPLAEATPVASLLCGVCVASRVSRVCRRSPGVAEGSRCRRPRSHQQAGPAVILVVMSKLPTELPVPFDGPNECRWILECRVR
jgi:hypothetical protein